MKRRREKVKIQKRSLLPGSWRTRAGEEEKCECRANVHFFYSTGPLLCHWGGGCIDENAAGKEVWSRDDDHSHLGNTGHMQFVISCATHLGFCIAPYLTCTCAPVHHPCTTFQPLQWVRLNYFVSYQIQRDKGYRILSLDVWGLDTWPRGRVSNVL